MKAKMLLLTLAALPFAANAEGFNYTFVEGVYVNSKFDSGPADVDGDGFGLRGSLGLNDTFHLFADYVAQDHKFGVDTTTYQLGGGARWGVQPNIDLIGEMSWVKAKVDTPFGSASDDGYGLGAGLRFRAGSRVELQGMINYVDIDGSDTSLALSGRYYLSNVLSLGAGLAFDDDTTGWHVGMRADFGRRR